MRRKFLFLSLHCITVILHQLAIEALQILQKALSCKTLCIRQLITVPIAPVGKQKHRVLN